MRLASFPSFSAVVVAQYTASEDAVAAALSLGRRPKRMPCGRPCKHSAPKATGFEGATWERPRAWSLAPSSRRPRLSACALWNVFPDAAGALRVALRSKPRPLRSLAHRIANRLPFPGSMRTVVFRVRWPLVWRMWLLAAFLASAAVTCCSSASSSSALYSEARHIGAEDQLLFLLDASERHRLDRVGSLIDSHVADEL